MVALLKAFLKGASTFDLYGDLRAAQNSTAHELARRTPREALATDAKKLAKDREAAYQTTKKQLESDDKEGSEN